VWRRLLLGLLVVAALAGVGLAALLVVSPETLVRPRTVTRVVVREKVVERPVPAETPAPAAEARGDATDPQDAAASSEPRQDADDVAGPGALSLERRTLNPVSAQQAIAMGLLPEGADSEVLVLRVLADGAADQAGLRGTRRSEWDGDVMQALNGTPVRTMDMLVTLLADHSAGDAVTVQVMRASGPRAHHHARRAARRLAAGLVTRQCEAGASLLTGCCIDASSRRGTVSRAWRKDHEPVHYRPDPRPCGDENSPERA
jgi:hypothetical protein